MSAATSRQLLRRTILGAVGLTLLAGCARPAAGGVTTGTLSFASTADSAATSPSASSTSAPTSVSGSLPGSMSPSGSAHASTVPTTSSDAPTVSSGISGRGGISTPLAQCAATGLPTLTTGVLTVAAPTILAAPWFSGPAPTDGGLEPAVVTAVAQTLGFAVTNVRWVRADPAKIAQGQTSGFDLAVGELRIPDQAGGAVDFSTGYFSIPTVVVARPSTVPEATIAALRPLRLGRVGSTTTLTDAIGTTATVTTYPNDPAALTALRAGAVQAVAVDAVTALASSDLRIVGALPATGKVADRALGLVLPHGSRLTSCVSTAVDLLRVQGTLAALSNQWVPIATLR